MENFDIETYLSEGTAAVVADIVKATLFHPAAAKFMARYAIGAKRASEKRSAAAPAFTAAFPTRWSRCAISASPSPRP